jgi:hypothetical protein
VESFEGSADSAGKILQFFVTLAMKESEKPTLFYFSGDGKGNLDVTSRHLNSLCPPRSQFERSSQKMCALSAV